MSVKSILIRVNSFVLANLAVINVAVAQKPNFDYSFYGFVRGDYYFNTRSNVEGVDGLFYLYPKNILLDPDGKDLNETPSGSFYTITTRLGLDIKGPDVGKAKTSAKIESDFCGATNLFFLLRLRQAHVRLDWQNGSSLMLGQAWHPLLGEVTPTILNISTGAPFQPFNLSPQINYQYAQGGWKLKAAAVYQLMYTSYGPAGKGEEYLKNGILPELYGSLDYRKNGFAVGTGIDMISLKPRLQSSVADGSTYRVDERVTSLSYEVHAEYVYNLLKIAGRTMLASNQGHNNLMGGGYGVSKRDERTGEQDYTPFKNAVSWLNVVYGKKLQGLLFVGYAKNLGTTDKLLNTTDLYGSGLDIDQFVNLSFCMRYVLPHWNIGLEYTNSTARYGDIDTSNGKISNTHGVTNHRLEAAFIYTF